MKKILISSVSVLFLVAFLSGCNTSNLRIMFAQSNSTSQTKATYRQFSGTEVRKMNLQKGQTVVIEQESEVDKGRLVVELLDPDQEVVYVFKTNQSETKEVVAEKAGTYELIIRGDKTKGSYKLKWKVY